MVCARLSVRTSLRGSLAACAAHRQAGHAERAGPPRNAAHRPAPARARRRGAGWHGVRKRARCGPRRAPACARLARSAEPAATTSSVALRRHPEAVPVRSASARMRAGECRLAARALSRRAVRTGGGRASAARRPSASPSSASLALASESSLLGPSFAPGAPPLRARLPRAAPTAPAPGRSEPWVAPAAAARASARSGLSASGALGSCVCVNVRLAQPAHNASGRCPRSFHHFASGCEHISMQAHLRVAQTSFRWLRWFYVEPSEQSS